MTHPITTTDRFGLLLQELSLNVVHVFKCLLTISKSDVLKRKNSTLASSVSPTCADSLPALILEL